jgi:hypothetical protein
MWESVLFLLQLIAVWVIIHWLWLNDRAKERRGELGLLALRKEAPKPPPRQQPRPGDPGRLHSSRNTQTALRPRRNG